MLALPELPPARRTRIWPPCGGRSAPQVDALKPMQDAAGGRERARPLTDAAAAMGKKTVATSSPAPCDVALLRLTRVLWESVWGRPRGA